MLDLLKEDFEKLWENNLPWEQFKNKTILVTGASGLIGTYLVYSLIDRNAQYAAGNNIIVLARNKARLQEKFGAYSNITIIAQDVCARIKIAGNLDYIVHAACDVQPKIVSLNPVGISKTVVDGTISVCELAIEKEAKLICISSLGIFGRMIERKPYNDEMPVYLPLHDSRYAYHEAKRMGEMLCASYHNQYGLEYSLLRMGRVYGPTMNLTDSAVLSMFIWDAVNGKDLILKSDGLQEYTYDYVGDVVSAIYYLMFKGNSIGYNCGEGEEIENIKFGEIVQLIADANHVHLIREVTLDNNSKSLQVVYSRLLSEELIKLGWNKKYSIQNGIDRTSWILKRRFLL